MCTISLPLSPQDVTIGFTQDTYDVPEGVGFLNVTIEVVGTLGRAVIVSLTTQDGTAVCKCCLQHLDRWLGSAKQ